MAHKWADWPHNPCHLESPQHLKAGDKITTDPEVGTDSPGLGCNRPTLLGDVCTVMSVVLLETVLAQRAAHASYKKPKAEEITRGTFRK